MDNTSSSLISLKAELFRKKEEVKGSSKQLPSAIKGRGLSQKLVEKKNRGVEQRARCDVVSNEEEADRLLKSVEILQRKSKLYDQLQSGGAIDESNGPMPYLVDFEQKVIDKAYQTKQEAEAKYCSQANLSKVSLGEIPMPVDQMQASDFSASTVESASKNSCEELNSTNADVQDQMKILNASSLIQIQKPTVVKSDDKLKLNSRPSINIDRSSFAKPSDLLSNDMYREQLRQKWEEEEQVKVSSGDKSVHYSDIRYDEARAHGAAFYRFSKDSEEREEQMRHLNRIREQSERQKSLVKEKRRKKKAAMAERLTKIRQRKGIELPKTEELDLDFTPDTKVAPLVREEQPKNVPIREWDRGKDLDMLWYQKKEKIREQRNAEFAPPSDYTSDSKHHLSKLRRIESDDSHSDVSDTFFLGNCH